MFGAAALAALASSVLTIETGPYPMLAIMLASAVCATISSALVIQRTKS